MTRKLGDLNTNSNIAASQEGEMIEQKHDAEKAEKKK